MSIIYLGKATPASGQGGGGSGEAVWGGITGTLSDQTDLADALSAKQATLISGTNIKTINNESLLGSGNITISGSVPNKNTAVGATNPLEFWEGTEAEYNSGGGSTTFYNWQSGGWETKNPNTSNSLSGIAFGNNKYIAVGASGTIISSSDSNTWTVETSGTSQGLYGVAFGNNIFVAVGESDTILTSSDGSTWSTETSGTSGEYLFDIIFNGSKFFAVGTNGVILSSSDGSSWTQETSNVTTTLRHIIYSNNTITVVGDSGTFLTSADGSTWTKVTTSGVSRFDNIAYGNGKYVTVSSYGSIKVSSNGTTWTSEISYVGADLYDVVFGNGKFIVVGDDGTIISSSGDGTWTRETSGVSYSLGKIKYVNNKYFAFRYMYGGMICYSEALSVYTTDENPTTESVIYSEPNVTSALTITSVGTGAITCSDTNTYTYNSSGNQTVTQTVGQAHPDWLCFIENVGIKLGNVSFIPTVTVDQTYNASSTNAQSGVAVASGINDTLGTINTQLESIIAQGD